MASNAAAGIAAAATESLLTGEDFGDTLTSSLPGIIANTVGGWISNRINDANSWSDVETSGTLDAGHWDSEYRTPQAVMTNLYAKYPGGGGVQNVGFIQDGWDALKGIIHSFSGTKRTSSSVEEDGTILVIGARLRAGISWLWNSYVHSNAVNNEIQIEVSRQMT